MGVVYLLLGLQLMKKPTDNTKLVIDGKDDKVLRFKSFMDLCNPARSSLQFDV